jgi:hypothetical protein
LHPPREDTARRWRAHLGEQGDRGSVIVEASLILPLLFLVIFGVIEIGGSLKSYSSVSNGVRAGGRMASVAGNNASADRMILERVAQEAAGIGKGEIEYVMVWHATGTGTPPPSQCLRAVPPTPNQSSQGRTVTGSCNIYFLPQAAGGAFDMATGRAAQPASYYFGCTGTSDPLATQKVDCFWPGKDRKITSTPRGITPVQSPDFVGVHVRAKHRYYTGILGSTLTITDSGVNLLEPQGYSLTASP